MKEANELKQIWDNWLWNPWYSNSDFDKCHNNIKNALWTLKAKIDSYKTQIIDACAEVDKLTRIINKIEAEMKVSE